jgi:hypothetical protein
MSARCGVLKVGGITVAIDGTKVLAKVKQRRFCKSGAGERRDQAERN